MRFRFEMSSNAGSSTKKVLRAIDPRDSVAVFFQLTVGDEAESISPPTSDRMSKFIQMGHRGELRDGTGSLSMPAPPLPVALDLASLYDKSSRAHPSPATRWRRR